MGGTTSAKGTARWFFRDCNGVWVGGSGIYWGYFYMVESEGDRKMNIEEAG